MDLHDLLKTDGPAFNLLVATDSQACDKVTALQHAAGNRLTLRTVRGRKAATMASFFDEFSAALQFPYYFGENWDAFNDCVTDLEWLPGEGYAVIITHAVHLLEKDSADALKSFVTVMQNASQHWRKPGKANKAKPFQVILHATKEEEAALKSKCHGVGISLGK
jgi:RNAse (barnase) inhibitor barstar